jgi:DNA-binding MarR family transcriptional regulator
MAEPELLTTHAQVLLCVADDCDARMRDIADRVGITERSAYRILNELVEAGYIERARNGRRNCYVLQPGEHLDQLGDLEQLVRLLRRGRRRQIAAA